MNFKELNLSDPILRALNELGISTLTDIQEKSIPVALTGRNIIGQARTGSGKTFAYALPIVEKILKQDITGKNASALIIVPTRELCKQVEVVISDLVKYQNTPKIRTVQVYGGVSIQNQISKINRGVNVIVATPGRLIDLFERKVIDFSDIKFVVLDEADRMLDMGFLPDIQFIMSKIRTKPQFLLFSATIIDEIKKLSTKFTGGDVVDINVSQDSMTVKNTKQFYYLIPHFDDKYYVFVRILRIEKPKHAIVFTNTKRTAEWLLGRLERERGLNLKLGMLSGNMSQSRREIVTDKFKKFQLNFLIATDVAARGLDIPNVSHVFNYDIPQYEENYVHRIGRTSRMDFNGVQQKRGVAMTLCLEEEYVYLTRIEGFINKSIKKRVTPPRTNFGSRNQSRGNRPSRGGYQSRDGNRYQDNRQSRDNRNTGRYRNDDNRRNKDEHSQDESSHRKRLPFF